MSILKRIKNLWAISEYRPLSPGEKMPGGSWVPPLVKEQEIGLIINTNDPADELLKTIREENTR